MSPTGGYNRVSWVALPLSLTPSQVGLESAGLEAEEQKR